MEFFDGGVTAPKGFKACGGAAGIRKNGRKDLAMIFSEIPAQVAGTFTTNVVKAAPVIWDRDIVNEGTLAQLIVCNSGIANACTGEEGSTICEETAREAAKAFGIPKEAVLVTSTGVIGKQVPIDKIRKGVEMLAPKLDSKREAAKDAAAAVLTTDTKSKEAAVSFEVDGKTVTLAGMCKGSGMIHPNMCTMLSFLTTDLAISKELLQSALSEVVKDTYNMISVDGDTSTNDTVLLLANGAAFNDKITEKNEAYDLFLQALLELNTILAKKIAGDGEGATALFEVKVFGAASKEDAVKLSKSVVSSNLTKAAICGHDANWGRILCALGYSGVNFNPAVIDLFFESAAGRITIMRDGVAVEVDEEKATEILSEPEVTVLCDMKMGESSATAWGCDLTCDYVKINSDYRS